jgi:hypothetical protein
MTRHSILAIATVSSLLVTSLAIADIKSGIPVGGSIKAFNPQHVTGPDAGKTACLV